VLAVVDTSVWVLAAGRLEHVEDYAGTEDIAVTPPVIQEFLRGAGSAAHFALARGMFRNLTILDAPMPLDRFEEAADLYIRCRDEGVTVRKSYDCLIAATALAHGATVVHRDNDFDQIARVLPGFRAKRV
jgi:predicted nucleic acid-binding protein